MYDFAYSIKESKDHTVAQVGDIRVNFLALVSARHARVSSLTLQIIPRSVCIVLYSVFQNYRSSFLY